MSDTFRNQLHYGDNLVRLRGEGVDKAIPDEIADLIYLDPPFNSARNYNLLFKQHKGQDSPAQIMTFEDTWQYSHDLLLDFKADPQNSPLFELIDSLHRILGPSEMMAYLLMMAPRLLELHRKLKKTGSLYLHCDPSASHYLKIILDVVFGPQFFRNEVVWKRSNAHNDAGRYGRIHDVLLFYTKGATFKWNKVFTDYSDAYLASEWKRAPNGELFKTDDMTDPQRRMALYDFMGTEARWRTGYEKMLELWNAEDTGIPQSHGRIKTDKEGRPLKRCRITFLSERFGVPLQDLFLDIPNVRGTKGQGEHRGYPTQKPLALLERIIAASTDEGDVVLDPFAGCGTALVAAERMNRKWIGIDVTYLAINEVVARLQEEKHQDRDLDYELLGTPKDENSAQALFRNTEKQNHKPFEQWAVTLVGGKYNEKKGADRGKDGVIQLWDMQGNYREGVIQVKGGAGLNLSNVRDFANVIESSKAVFGIMIAQKEPTKEMKLVAEQMGYADWPGQRKIPRYQILTTEGILERGEQPIIPQDWLIHADKGVGKAVAKQTETLFDER